jgi:sec-independent protein translocase protein TatA
MFELGLPEILVIGGAALLLFGPKRLPELAKSLGKGIRDFKKALEEDDSKSHSTASPGADEGSANEGKQALPAAAVQPHSPPAATQPHSLDPEVETVKAPAGETSGGSKNS